MLYLMILLWYMCFVPQKRVQGILTGEGNPAGAFIKATHHENVAERILWRTFWEGQNQKVTNLINYASVSVGFNHKKKETDKKRDFPNFCPKRFLQFATGWCQFFFSKFCAIVVWWQRSTRSYDGDASMTICPLDSPIYQVVIVALHAGSHLPYLVSRNYVRQFTHHFLLVSQKLAIPQTSSEIGQGRDKRRDKSWCLVMSACHSQLSTLIYEELPEIEAGSSFCLGDLCARFRGSMTDTTHISCCTGSLLTGINRGRQMYPRFVQRKRMAKWSTQTQQHI